MGTAFLLHRAWDIWVDGVPRAGLARASISSRRAVHEPVRASVHRRPDRGAVRAGRHDLPLLASAGADRAAASLAYVFYHLLKAPTLAGAAIRDQIDGFRMFLDTAEKDRLEILNPPEVTPAGVREIPALCHRARLRERVEQEIRGRSGGGGHGCPAAARAIRPLWYSGSSFNRSARQASSARLGHRWQRRGGGRIKAPGSSSGSGGGGFSGGGGGGGGGGGW